MSEWELEPTSAKRCAAPSQTASNICRSSHNGIANTSTMATRSQRPRQVQQTLSTIMQTTLSLARKKRLTCDDRNVMEGIPELIRPDLRRVGVASVWSQSAVEAYEIYGRQNLRNIVLDYVDDVDDVMSVDESEVDVGNGRNRNEDDAMEI